MKVFVIVFVDGGFCTRLSEDYDTLKAEIAEEFPGREINYIYEESKPLAN